MGQFIKKAAAFLLVFCFIFSAAPLPTEAAALNLRYNGQDCLYEDMQPIIKYEGKTISLSKCPALIMENVAMVPYYEVFVKNGPKAKKSYNSTTKQLTLSLGGTFIVLTLNSKVAFVNGKEMTLPVAPVSVTYKDTKTTRILVPSRKICSYWGMDYSWDKASRTVSMKAPVQGTSSTNNTTDTKSQTSTSSGTETADTTKSTAVKTYYRGSKAYKAKICTVSFEGTAIPLADTPALTISKYNMVPLYEALCKNGPKMRRSYNSKTKIVKVSYQSNLLTMKIGSKSAIINGEKIKLPAAPILIKYKKGGSSRIMVPIRYVSLYLGLAYQYTGEGRAISLQKALSIKYNNKFYCYTGVQNDIYAEGQKVDSAVPSINFGGVPYIPIYYVCQKKYGLGISYSYQSKQATLTTTSHKAVATMGSAEISVDGVKKTMEGKALLVRFAPQKKYTAMVPASSLCDALDLSYEYKDAAIRLKKAVQGTE